MERGSYNLAFENDGSAAKEGDSKNIEQNVEKDTVEVDDKNCGWWCFKPKVLQRFRTSKWVLFWMCWAAGIQGMVVNGFVNVVITTIERRFGLTSSQTGVIAVGYDIASFICMIPVTYIGGNPRASKPKWIGYGFLIMGLGSFFFSLPHFLAEHYKGRPAGSNLCHRNETFIGSTCSTTDPNQTEDLSSSVAMALFLIGQLLHGAGSSPLFTLGVTFIESTVTKKMTSIYLGIYFSAAIIGPALGYLLGGQMLRLYTDFSVNDPEDVGVIPGSNVWVGAWWLGFIVAAGVSILVAIPLLAFPPSLPNAEELKKGRVSEAHGEDPEEEMTEFTKLKDMPKAFKALAMNPTFCFLNLGGSAEGFLVAGFGVFLPKLMETQFNITPSFAAMMMGLITVPAGGGGTFLGGYLIKKFKLKCSGIIKLCIGIVIVGTAFTFAFLLNCSGYDFAGVNTPYDIDRQMHLQVQSHCNFPCNCNSELYDPVCGADNVMYYSPCFAGCTNGSLLNGNKVYSDCSCILNTTPDKEYDAIGKSCASSCGKLWIFVVLMFGSMVGTFLTTQPVLNATLRCVREDQKSFAVGNQWIIVRILGTIPGPIVFGSIIDKTCLLWFEKCTGTGACLMYKSLNMAKYMLGISLIGRALSISFFFLAWYFYKAPSDKRPAMNGGEL